MENRLSKAALVNYITKIVLMLFFAFVFILFIFRVPSITVPGQEFHLSVLDLVLLAFATLRIGRMLTYDLVAEPLRYPFIRTVPDEAGMGDTVEPRTNGGVRGALGQLLSCPICTGTWVAAALVYFLYLWPSPARLLLTIMGTIGIAETLNAIVEALCWQSEASHTQAGLNKAIHKGEIPSGGQKPRF